MKAVGIVPLALLVGPLVGVAAARAMTLAPRVGPSRVGLPRAF